VEGCYLIGAVIGRAGSCRFRRCTLARAGAADTLHRLRPRL